MYPIPYMIDDMFPNGLDDFVAKLHSREHFDYVMVEYVFMSKALTKLGKEVTKILTHMIFWLTEHICIMILAVKPKTFYTNKHQERKGLLRADIILAIQKDERRYFAKQVRNRRRVLTIGNYFETAEHTEVKQNRKWLFVGIKQRIQTENATILFKRYMEKGKEKSAGGRVPDCRGCQQFGRSIRIIYQSGICG